MLKAFLVASTLVSFASTSVWPCVEGPLLMPHAIRINICPNYNATCSMKRGTTFRAELDFLATHNVQSLHPHVTVHVVGTTLFRELPTDRQVGCNWITRTSCPLAEGESVTYLHDWPTTVNYPLMVLDYEIRLYDHQKNLQFCVSIEIDLVA